jgi:hypothetical protein
MSAVGVKSSFGYPAPCAGLEQQYILCKGANTAFQCGRCRHSSTLAAGGHHTRFEGGRRWRWGEGKIPTLVDRAPLAVLGAPSDNLARVPAVPPR